METINQVYHAGAKKRRRLEGEGKMPIQLGINARPCGTKKKQCDQTKQTGRKSFIENNMHP
jgi:hypothetical protein